MVLDELVEKLARGAPRGDDPPDEAPRAAVAAILRERRDEDARGAAGVELFFIRRAEHPKDPWSGHIAFPGGRRDPDDATLLDTAIRETREEVGIELRREHFVARLPSVPAFNRSSRGLLVVAPFVFAVRDAVEVSPNHEVSATLWVPLTTLARGDGRGTFTFTWEGQSHEMPCIRLPPAEYVLWGMTYRMLLSLLEHAR